MPEKTRFELSNGVTLVGDYYDSPSNKGIVLLPGITEHRSSLEETAKKLNTEFKTWIFDINSQGESSGNWDLKEMNQSAHALIHQLRQRFGLAKMGAQGNSMGGMTIGLTAAQKNTNLDCICLASTPAGLLDVLPEYAIPILSHIPQPLVRLGTIAFDKIQTRRHVNYRQKTHAQFQQNGKYQPYAQWGATKIPNIKEFMGWIANAPRLDDVAKNIRQPALLIYGGNDGLVLRIKDGVLPPQLQKLYTEIGSPEKRLIVVAGADHSLNTSTKPDDCFNQEPKYQYVKEEIFNHFAKYLL